MRTLVKSILFMKMHIWFTLSVIIFASCCGVLSQTGGPSLKYVDMGLGMDLGMDLTTLGEEFDRLDYGVKFQFIMENLSGHQLLLQSQGKDRSWMV